MAKYYLHEINDSQFEEIVAEICIRILGSAFVNFSAGIDGGRDGVFRGTPNLYPSEASNATGTTIVQAKHTTIPTLHCGLSAFKDTIIDEEIARLNKIIPTEAITNYIIFTNRKLSGVTEPEIVNKIKSATNIPNVSIFGVERLDLFLDKYPEIANKFGLNNFRTPLKFSYNDVSMVVTQLGFTWKSALQNSISKYDLDYTEIENKNIVNNLTVDYFEHIKDNSEQYFYKINNFLEEPSNNTFAEAYFALSEELKGKLIAHQEKFPTFDKAIEEVIELSIQNNHSLQSPYERRIVRVFIHFMYCNCDIGKKK